MVRALTALLAAFVVCGCARFGFEVVEASADVGAPFGERDAGEGIAPLHDAGVGGAASSSPVSGFAGDGSLDMDASTDLPPGTSLDASSGGGGAGAGSSGAGGSVAGAAGVAGTGGTAGTNGVTFENSCVLRGNETVVDHFDNGTDGAQTSGTGLPDVTWSAIGGTPTPGALDFTNSVGGTGTVRYVGSLGDLSGRVASMSARALSGSSVQLRLFVETAQGRENGPVVSPAGSEWECLTLDMDSPASSDVGADPHNVQSIGVEIVGVGNVHVQLDQIAY
jgi:hypothetical protein